MNRPASLELILRYHDSEETHRVLLATLTDSSLAEGAEELWRRVKDSKAPPKRTQARRLA